MSTSTYIPGTPFIRSFEVTPTTQGLDNGSIFNVTVTGGTPPYTVVWNGGNPAGSYTTTGLTLTNLESTPYSGTVTDTKLSASTSVILVPATPTVSFTASTTVSACTNNINKFCQITVSGFTHTQWPFYYKLYKDGDIFETYVGNKSGDESYVFDDLPQGFYTLSAYDGNSVKYVSTPIEGVGGCLDGKIATSYTGLSGSYINNNYEFYQPHSKGFLTFVNGRGPGAISSTTVTYPSGLLKNGTIDVNNPYAWLYTGATENRLTDSTYNWYMGVSAATTQEGVNIGPTATVSTLPTDLKEIGKFYWNPLINKFVGYDMVSNSQFKWVTFDASTHEGRSNPVASHYLSANTFTSGSLSSPTLYPTITGLTTSSSGTSVMSSAFLNATNGRLSSQLNNAYPVGMVSLCEYTNYVHEVTINSTEADDDTIGFVLAAMRDSDGLFGKAGTSYDLSFVFNSSGSGNGTEIRYNGMSGSAYAFTGNTNPIAECPQYSSCPSTPSGFLSTRILKNDETKSPFATGNYNGQGSVRVRIERHGSLGEEFKIQITDAFGTGSSTHPLGSVVGYNPAYEINFSLLDKTTWVGNNLSAENYSNPQELQKFLGAQRIGYMEISQDNTNFYHITLTGTQTTVTSRLEDVGPNTSQTFDLYNPNTVGLEMTNTTGVDYGNSFNQAEVGKPEVPRIRPTIKVEMQTTEFPEIKLTGGTKIFNDIDGEKVKTKDYDVLNDVQITGLTSCINFNFEWTTNTVDMINGNMYPKYSIYPYDATENEFSTTPLLTRVFDRPTQISDSYDGRRIIGKKITASDCVDTNFLGIGSNYQFLIKPSFLYSDKLENILTTSCDTYQPFTAMTHQTWYDSLDLNSGPSTQYGIYDKKTDFYFVAPVTPPLPNVSTSNFTYTDDIGNMRLYSQQVQVASGSTTGITEVPLLVSGSPYTIVLEYPTAGSIQLTLNGLTLFPASDSQWTDGDYYFNGTQIITFPPDVLEEFDIMNIYYVPGSTPQSYYVENYSIPSPIPTGSTNNIGEPNSFYTNLYYYFYQTKLNPRGAIGMALNGSPLLDGSDFVRVSGRTVQFLTLTEPDGIQENDILTLFYVTDISLRGVANRKDPRVSVEYLSNPQFNEKLILDVIDLSGNTVSQDIGTLSKNIFGIQTVDLMASVPKPGKYEYEIKSIRDYKLLNGKTLTKINITSRYPFEMPASVFYDESGAFKPSDNRRNNINNNNNSPSTY
tara:strand:- start:1577 stop:5236 length:3660 start_codon:yes stop_codon:yes gene_type:complete